MNRTETGGGDATAQSEETDGSIRRIEQQVAILLRLGAGALRVGRVDGHLERSAYLLLTILTDQGPTSVNALAERLDLNASTITRQVDAMAAAELVDRFRHPDDGRVTLVAATDRGWGALAASRAARHRFYESVTASWSEQDRRDLARLLTRLNQDLDQVGRGL